MRVGILINSIEVFGGIGKIAIEEVKNLRKLGVDAELLVFSDWGKENKYEEISCDIPIVRLPQRLPKSLRINRKVPFFTVWNFCHLFYPLYLPFYIKKGEWDLVINHESYLTFFLLRLKRKKIKYIQFIWDPISYIIKRVYTKGILNYLNRTLYRIGLWLDHLFIRKSEMVLTGGQAHEEFIKKTGKKYKILYPSVYPQEKINENREKFVFMMTAWKQGKNPEYVLELLEKMPELRIKMGGLWLDKNYEKSFRSLVREKKLEERIEVLGSISERDLNNYLSRATVLLQTNDDRGFGMPALETAACGCSFIIPEGQGVCNLFSNEKEGFFTREKDTERIISLLGRFLSDQVFARQMGKAAWERVKNNYSWRIHAQEIINLARGLK
ncbi:MAG TPA: glycosyltransferase [Candidatus Moranbacteria bacterium]|nr:glycosyltransferase [Candidatus Moranbacteria bacterium]